MALVIFVCRDKIDYELMASPPSHEEAGPSYPWGRLARLRRSYCKGGKPVLNISNSPLKWGCKGPLMEFLTLQKSLAQIVFRNNDLSNDDLLMIMECISFTSPKITSIDLSNNAICGSGVGALFPTLQVIIYCWNCCKRGLLSWRPSHSCLFYEQNAD